MGAAFLPNQSSAGRASGEARTRAGAIGNTARKASGSLARCELHMRVVLSSQILLGILFEGTPAPRRAEEVRRAFVFELPSGVFGGDVHAADRVFVGTCHLQFHHASSTTNWLYDNMVDWEVRR